MNGKEKKSERFDRILRKGKEDGEITVDECERLLNADEKETNRLIEVADELREERVGDTVTYVINRNINFTNICKNSCKFCAFRRNVSDPDSFTLSKGEVRDKTQEAVRNGATEICLQGGINPSLNLDDYLNYLEAIREVSSDIHIHAFSPEEIDYMGQKTGEEIEKILKILKNSGLDSVPGTAAEILVDRVRKVICPQKVDSEDWRHIIETCHKLDIPSTATIMYGHIESNRDIAVHLDKLREIQRKTGGFTELVPLGFASKNTNLEREREINDLNEREHLKIHAVSRLMLAGEIDNIQTSWVKLSPKLAQKTLNAGANDFSGTLMEENITKAAGGDMEHLSPAEMERLIREEGKIPKERTTTYEIIS